MSLGSVVLFPDKIASDVFEKDFDQMGAVPVVINNQDASLFFDRRARHTKSSRGGVLAAVSCLFRKRQLASNIPIAAVSFQPTMRNQHRQVAKDNCGLAATGRQRQYNPYPVLG